MNESRIMPGARESCSRLVVLYTGWTNVISVQRHTVDESSPYCVKLTVNSFCMLLYMYLSSSLATSVDSWLRYTLNKLDTESKGSTRFRNPRAVVMTTKCSEVVT